MAIRIDSLEICIAESDYGLSALRLMEHTELGQINPFGKAIGQRVELNDTSDFIDVVRFAPVPDQGHELLFDVQGVRLTEAIRKAMLASGLPAWG